MRSLTSVSVFLAAALVILLAWGRSLWYFAERSQALRRSAFFLMGFTRRPIVQVQSLLLSVIYCGLGLLAALLLATLFGFHASSLVTLKGSHLVLAVLGAVGEISLTSLLVELCCRVTPNGRARLVEINEIPWIKGVRRLPAGAAPVAAGLAGVVEELFFRGVVLRILTDRLLVPAAISIAIAGTLFYIEQLVQLRTAFQALVIGCSCVAISLVGGMLLVFTGSIVPALIAHASFVLFFMNQGGEDSANYSKGRTRTTTR